MLPPVEVISMPSWPLPKVGSSLNAARPQKVLYDVKSLALSRTTMPFCPLAATTLPSGIGPPIRVRVDVPSTTTPFRPLPTAVSLSAPMPKKLA